MDALTMGSVLAALAAGFVSFFSPCTLPVLPVYVAFLAADAEGERKSVASRLLSSLAFTLGLVTVFVALGFGAGALGKVVNSSAFGIICGMLVIVMGIYLTGAIRIPALEREWRPGLSLREGGGAVAAYLLGLGFSLGWTPCVGPVLASVLALAAQEGSALVGGVLLAVYALGLGVPFIALSVGSGALLERVSGLKRYTPQIKAVGGALIAALGLWMVISSARAEVANSVVENVPAVSESTSTESSDESSSTDEYAALQEAARFTLRSMDGGSVGLESYAGRPLIIKVWGTWCPPCMAGLAEYQEFAQEMNESGEAYVASVVIPGRYGEKSEEAFEEWYAEQGMTLEVLYDTGAFVDGLGIQSFPTFLLYDRDGAFVGGQIGDPGVETLRDIVGELNAEAA